MDEEVPRPVKQRRFDAPTSAPAPTAPGKKNQPSRKKGGQGRSAPTRRGDVSPLPSDQEQVDDEHDQQQVEEVPIPHVSRPSHAGSKRQLDQLAAEQLEEQDAYGGVPDESADGEGFTTSKGSSKKALAARIATLEHELAMAKAQTAGPEREGSEYEFEPSFADSDSEGDKSHGDMDPEPDVSLEDGEVDIRGALSQSQLVSTPKTGFIAKRNLANANLPPIANVFGGGAAGQVGSQNAPGSFAPGHSGTSATTVATVIHHSGADILETPVNESDIYSLRKDPNSIGGKRFRDQLLRVGHHIDLHPPDPKWSVAELFSQSAADAMDGLLFTKEWRTRHPKEVLDMLSASRRGSSTDISEGHMALATDIQAVPLMKLDDNADILNEITRFTVHVKQSLRHHRVPLDAKVESVPYEAMRTRLLSPPCPKFLQGIGARMKQYVQGNKDLTWDDLFKWLGERARKLEELKTWAEDNGLFVSLFPIQGQSSSYESTQDSRTSTKHKKGKSKGKYARCNGCNNFHEKGSGSCPFKGQFGYNRNLTVSWEASDIGKLLIAQGIRKLPVPESFRLAEPSSSPSEREPGGSSSASGQQVTSSDHKDKKPHFHGGKAKHGEYPVIAALSTEAPPLSSGIYILTQIVSPFRSQPEEEAQPKAKALAYLDAGAPAGDCLSSKTLQLLRQSGVDVDQGLSKGSYQCVCGAISDHGKQMCSCGDTFVSLTLKFLVPPEMQLPFINYQTLYTINFRVLDNLDDDLQLVIGLSTIRQYDFTMVFRLYYTLPAKLDPRPSAPPARIAALMATLPKCRDHEIEYARVHRDELLQMVEGCNEGEDSVFWRETLHSDLLSDDETDDGGDDDHGPLAGFPAPVSRLAAMSAKRVVHSKKAMPNMTVRRMTRQLSLRFRRAMVKTKRGRLLLASMQPLVEVQRRAVDEEELPKIVGDDHIHNETRALVLEYADVFRKKVSRTPAKLTPMVLKFTDEKLWRRSSNARPPRMVSPVKREAIKAELQKLEAAGVIQRSQATHYSQVLLVPKPGNKWRLCIDYRSLNECIEGMGWPIPNITQLVRRIGEKNPRWYAVLDLTAGYHQVLLDEQSRSAAAFITPVGLYEPVRISMGLKSAPSYFQQRMQTEVLGGLVGSICEVYIDDIIIYGSTEEEFIDNLRQVLERLREYHITINPEKAKIAVQRVEAVGHVMDQYGITMSEEKIKKVMDFPLPKLGSDLKRFLGLANYFRTHIRNYHELEKPLSDSVVNYKAIKNRPVKWTDTTKSAFRELQGAIGKCPKLYFVDSKLPIFLETDASEIGMGAYLYQLSEDGTHLPIAFMSRSFQGAQKNWPTIEKECFAIYSALREWEYLLRDVRFIIRTDHRNLRYLNTNTPKVVRWKLAVQEFDFYVEYIKGEDNVAADALSRIERDDVLVSSCAPEGVSTVEGPSTCESPMLLARLETRKRGLEALYSDEDPLSHPEYQVTDAHVYVPMGKEKGDNEGLVETYDYGALDFPKPPTNNDPLKEVVWPPHAFTAEEMRDAIRQAEPQHIPPHHDLLAPTLEQLDMIGKVHNCFRGHHGVQRTYDMLCKVIPSNEKWPHMRHHVRSFVNSCPACQKMRPLKTLLKTCPFTTATYKPMHRINIDTIGPLPVDQMGNKHIIVMIDCFSRYCELYAVPSTSALDCARCLIDFIGRYGAPSYLLSDRGSQFVNEIISALTMIVGTQQLFSIAYSKEENAVVERGNKEVMKHLRGMIFDTRLKNHWSWLLPLVQRILNATSKESLGVSPAQLIFGNAIDLDRGLFFNDTLVDANDKDMSKSVREFLDKLLHNQAIVLEVAQEQQASSDAKHVAQRMGKKGALVSSPQYEVNSFVLLRYPASLGGGHKGPTKLHLNLRGPYKIVAIQGDRLTLQHLVTEKLSTHHKAEVTPFISGSSLDPKQVAMRDQDDYDIESILEHTGDFADKDSLRFRVRWAGFNAFTDTWEPWRNLRSTDALHDYLRKCGMERHIPQEFRTPSRKGGRS